MAGVTRSGSGQTQDVSAQPQHNGTRRRSRAAVNGRDSRPAANSPASEAAAHVPAPGAAANRLEPASKPAATGPLEPAAGVGAQAGLRTHQQADQLEAGPNPNDTLDQPSMDDVIPPVHQLFRGPHYGQLQLPGLLPAPLPSVMPSVNSLQASGADQQLNPSSPQLLIPNLRLQLSPQLQGQVLNRDQSGPCQPPLGDQSSPKVLSPPVAPASADRILRRRSGSLPKSDVNNGNLQQAHVQAGKGLPTGALSAERQQLPTEGQMSKALLGDVPFAKAAKAEQQSLKAKRGMMNTRSVRSSRSVPGDIQAAHTTQRSDSAAPGSAAPDSVVPDSAAPQSAQDMRTRRSLRRSSKTTISEPRDSAAATGAVLSSPNAPALPSGRAASVLIPASKLPYAPSAPPTTTYGQIPVTSSPPAAALGPLLAADPATTAPISPLSPPSAHPKLGPTAAPSASPALDCRAILNPVRKAVPSSVLSAPPKAGSSVNPQPPPGTATRSISDPRQSDAAPSADPSAVPMPAPNLPQWPPLNLAEAYAADPTGKAVLDCYQTMCSQIGACIAKTGDPVMKQMLESMLPGTSAKSLGALSAAPYSSSDSDSDTESDSDSDLESTPGPNLTHAVTQPPCTLPLFGTAGNGHDSDAHSPQLPQQHMTGRMTADVPAQHEGPPLGLPNQAWKSANQLHSPGRPPPTVSEQAAARQTAASKLLPTKTSSVVPSPGLTTRLKQKKQGSPPGEVLSGPDQAVPDQATDLGRSHKEVKKRKGAANMGLAKLAPGTLHQKCIQSMSVLLVFCIAVVVSSDTSAEFTLQSEVQSDVSGLPLLNQALSTAAQTPSDVSFGRVASHSACPCSAGEEQGCQQEAEARVISGGSTK